MFLQILTENAIVHGLKGLEGHKELHISISRQQDVTIIRVTTTDQASTHAAH